MPPPAFPTTILPIHVTRLPSSITVPSSIVITSITGYPSSWIPSTVIFVPVSSISSLPSSVITHISIPTTVVIPTSI